MRVCLCCIIVICLLFSSFAFAETEVLFQKIPWLSNDSTTFKLLFESGYIRVERLDYLITKENSSYICKDETGLAFPDNQIEYQNVCYAMDIGNNVQGKVGGYPIDEIVPVFAYDGEYKLIAIRIELLLADFNSLKDKLKKQYGDCETTTIEEDEVESLLWVGENNTCVLLFTSSGGLDYTLMYGRLDAVEILSNCLTAPDPNDVAGL